MGSTLLSVLSVDGGAVTPLAAAGVDETFAGIAVTQDSVVVSSNVRVATVGKDASSLATLATLPDVYLLEAEPHGSSAVFVQALGDAETCSGGSIVYESSVPGTPVALATLPPGCATHVVFDDDAVYWSNVGGLEVFKVTRR